jgi:phage-related protein
MPLVRKLVDHVWELRSSLPSRREARVLFTANEHRIVILSAFIKKAQKTPASEIELARTSCGNEVQEETHRIER